MRHSEPVLVDTHVLLWWFMEDRRLGKRQSEILFGASDKHPLTVSDITLWEIARLVSLGRLTPPMPVRPFLDRVVAPPLVERVGITTAVAATVAELPDSFHRDPADRVIVATAMVLGATLLTSDREIRASGLVRTI